MTATLTRAKENCARLFLLCQEVIANPTQAAIDALTSAAATASTLAPRPTTSLDGESIQWEGYAESLLRQMDLIDKLLARASGPFEVRSRGVT